MGAASMDLLRANHAWLTQLPSTTRRPPLVNEGKAVDAVCWFWQCLYHGVLQNPYSLLWDHMWSSVQFWALHTRKTLAYWSGSTSQGLYPVTHLFNYKTIRLTGGLIAVYNYLMRDVEQTVKLFSKMHTRRTSDHGHKQERVKFQLNIGRKVFTMNGQALEQAAQWGKCWTWPRATCSNRAWLSRRLDYVISRAPFQPMWFCENLYNIKEAKIGEQEVCCYHWFNTEDSPQERCKWTAELTLYHDHCGYTHTQKYSMFSF